jgi:hypothetical protein
MYKESEMQVVVKEKPLGREWADWISAGLHDNI